METFGKQKNRPGRTVLLSAGMPRPDDDNVRKLPHNYQELAEAIISLARGAFSVKGRLAFGGDPTIALLLGMSAVEYLSPRFAERGELRRGHNEDMEEWAEPLASLYLPRNLQEGWVEFDLLRQLGYIDITWRPMEGFWLGASNFIELIEESDPIALVCLGGMKDVEQQVGLFSEKRPESPIFTVAATGGAAERIASKDMKNVRVIDRDLIYNLKNRARDLPSGEYRHDILEMKYVPYPLIIQTMLAHLFNLDL